MVAQLPYPCIVEAAIVALAVFVTAFLLGYWRPPRIVFRGPEIVRQYIVKEDGSIELVEPSSLPPEKQRIVEEKIRVLKEELKREAVQRFTEEWRRNRKRRLLYAVGPAVALAIGGFTAVYLACRLAMCLQYVP
jgi:hypothetical protein